MIPHEWVAGVAYALSDDDVTEGLHAFRNLPESAVETWSFDRLSDGKVKNITFSCLRCGKKHPEIEPGSSCGGRARE